MADTGNKQMIGIADAFERHFRHFGFKKTIVDEVASELGVSKKTIYKYFNSKDDIFYFIISRKAEARRSMIEKVIADMTSACEMMKEMILINFTEFRKVHKKRIPGFDERFQSEIASAAFTETFKRMLKEIINKGIDQEEFEVGDVELTVRYILSLIFETVKVIRADHTAKPEEYLIATVIKLLQKNSQSKIT